MTCFLKITDYEHNIVIKTYTCFLLERFYKKTNLKNCKNVTEC